MAKEKDDKLQTAKTQIGRATVSRFPRNFAVAVVLLCALFNRLSFFQSLDDRWVDTMFAFRGAQQADPRIAVVAIDDDSIREIGVFPWPRHVYKKLVDRLIKRGVKVVALDIMFFEPSGNDAADKALIDMTRQYGDRIVHAVANDTGITDRIEFLFPFPALRRAAKSLGFVAQSWVDKDGSVRFTPTAVGPTLDMKSWGEGKDLVPALGVASLMVFEGKPMTEYTRHGYKIRLNWRGNNTDWVPNNKGEYEEKVIPMIPQISASKILRDDTLPAKEAGALNGGIALVASTTLGNFDHYPSPFSENTPGVLVHANLIDNLMHSRYLRVIDYNWSYATIALLAGAAFYFAGLSPVLASLLFAGFLFAWTLSNYVLFRSLYVLEFAAPTCALVVTFLALMVHRAIEENRKAAEVRGMFGQYVAPEVVDILVKNPDKLRLGGEKRDMTMFFLDIAHFTTISEKMSPENLIQFLNHYLTALTDDILSNNGVVDKYIGDCIMAFWNAPLDEPDHRRKACLAAVSCVRTIERLNKEYVDPSMPETPAVRIGLNSGEVVVGNTGSARKLAYTVLGDEVNLASRLEGANKFFGSTLMASEDTYNGGKDVVEGRLLGAVRVVGKAIPIKVYELLAKKGELPENWAKGIPIYHDAIKAYEVKKFDEAIKGFEAFLKLVPDDKTAKLYLNSCNDYVVIPPPEGWEPVFNLTSK